MRRRIFAWPAEVGSCHGMASRRTMRVDQGVHFECFPELPFAARFPLFEVFRACHQRTELASPSFFFRPLAGQTTGIDKWRTLGGN